MTVGDLKVQDYLQHMLEATKLALSYVAGMDKSVFLSDRRTQQAVVPNLITLGEIATRLMSEHPEFASKHSSIPWRQMRGMRNRMAHGYFDINLEIVWATVQTSLPELDQQLDVLSV